MEKINDIIFNISIIIPIVCGIITFFIPLWSFIISGKKENKCPWNILMLLSIPIFILSICVCIYKTKLVEVPRVKDMQYSSAVQTLSEQGLLVKNYNEEYMKDNTIIKSQIPLESTIVRKGTSIELDVITPYHVNINPPTAVNSIGNKYYQNNDGHLCVQGNNYYLATDNSIYLTDYKFKKFIKLTDATLPMNLNVIGNYIYYSTEDGIYKIKYDGTERKLLFATYSRTLKMQVQDGQIYYIKANDSKLYCGPISGGKSNIVYEKEISNFCVVGLNIYICNAEIERFPTNNYPKRIKNKTISKISFNGGNEKIIYPCKNTNINSSITGDFGFSDNVFYFLTNEGLYSYNDEINRICNANFADGLCIFNSCAYFIESQDNQWILYEYDLNEKDNINKYKIPIKSLNTLPQFIYPIQEQIILSVDLSTWYSLNKSSKDISILTL